jgi:predicted O-methyltransferase YrrM
VLVANPSKDWHDRRMPKPDNDPFTKVRAQTLRHRAQHGCGTYPFEDGAILGVIAASVAPKRVLELGTALGYTSLWFAHGAPDARIDTIELDPVHVRLARENFAAFGVDARVTVHPGDFAAVLPTLEAGYDLAFFDGFSPTPDYLRAFRELLRPRGVLISSNLHFRDAETRAYRDLLFGGGEWLTAAISDGDTAMSVRL